MIKRPGDFLFFSPRHKIFLIRERIFEMKEEKKITLAEFGQSMLEDFSMAEGDGGVKTVPEREKAKAGVSEPFMDSDSLSGPEEGLSAAWEEEIILEEAGAEPKEILFEDISKRSENVKHFCMRDGSFMAAVYPRPVHYRDSVSGEYREISREFKELEDSYEAKNHNFRAVFPKKAGKRNYFSVQKDGY